MVPNQIEDALTRAFFPFAKERLERVVSRGARFVHYTSAHAAISMIENREVWLRNATTMNDFMEVEYGLGCLTRAYSAADCTLKAVLDEISPGTRMRLEEQFNGWLPTIRSQSYVLCLSEHVDAEDKLGRLSMWRAYSRSAGVALILNNRVFTGRSNALGAYSSPVAYLGDAGVSTLLQDLARGIHSNAELVRGLGAEAVMGLLFNAFLFAVLCTKHPGFHEEMEWRVCHVPGLHRQDRITMDIKTIGELPQMVAKLPLNNIVDEGLVGLSIPELVNRIVIGPCDFPGALFDVFVHVLKKAGVSDAEQRVFISDIPLRRS